MARPRMTEVRMSTFAVKADKFFLLEQLLVQGYLLVEDGVFGHFTKEKPDCEIIDRTGSWVAPILLIPISMAF